MDEFKFSIFREPFRDSIGMMFIRYQNGKTYVASPVELQFKEVKPYDSVGLPTLSLSSFDAKKFFSALAEAMDHEGIKTDSDAKITGTLEATREHLKDLQALVFKGKR